MVNVSAVKEHMEVIGADGVHVGTVDHLEGDRIKLTKKDSGTGKHEGHHHYLSTGLIATIEGDRVRLSTTGANALLFEEEQTGRSIGRAKNAGSDRDWRTIGLSAAAAASAVAGAAALYARKRSKGDEDFTLRLQTDENIRLISSAKVEGTPVVARDGTSLGRIENVMIDKYSGRVAYAVMTFGGIMGFGESLFPLPWSMLDYDVTRDGYVLDVTKEQLSNAPSFKPSEKPEFDTNYRRRITLFYS